MERKENVLDEKSFDFAVKTVKLYKKIIREEKEYVLPKQFLRSGTSIGAMNGAMYVEGKLDIAYDYWYNISSSKVLDIDDKYLTELLNLSINQNNLFYFIFLSRSEISNLFSNN